MILNTSIFISKVNEVLNIIGTDNVISTDIEADLTDTIMIASYNPNTQTANILSIPRDTFIGKNKYKPILTH